MNRQILKGVFLLATLGILIAAIPKAQEEPVLNKRVPGEQLRYVVIVFDEGTEVRVARNGMISRSEFQKQFNSDYSFVGERARSPESSVIVGALIVFDTRATVTLPIHRWEHRGLAFFQCQGTTDDGIAPKYSVQDSELRGLLNQIEKDLM